MSAIRDLRIWVTWLYKQSLWPPTRFKIRYLTWTARSTKWNVFAVNERNTVIHGFIEDDLKRSECDGGQYMDGWSQVIWPKDLGHLHTLSVLFAQIDTDIVHALLLHRSRILLKHLAKTDCQFSGSWWRHNPCYLKLWQHISF